jgi:hypothetical protein
MTGEQMLKAIGFEKERFDGFDYFDNHEYGITFFDDGGVKVDSHKKPVIILPILIMIIYTILKERGHIV